MLDRCLGVAVDVRSVFWRRPCGVHVEVQADGGSGAIGIDRPCGREVADQLDAESQSGVSRRIVDADALVGDGNADLSGVAFDRQVDVAQSVWVGMADGVSERFAHGKCDRGKQLVVDYTSLG